MKEDQLFVSTSLAACFLLCSDKGTARLPLCTDAVSGLKDCILSIKLFILKPNEPEPEGSEIVRLLSKGAKGTGAFFCVNVKLDQKTFSW